MLSHQRAVLFYHLTGYLFHIIFESPPKHISLPSLPDNSRPAHYQKRHTQKQLYTDKVIITVITVISLFFVNREEPVPPQPPPTTHHLIFKIPHVL